jgi:hypothetical protein
VSSFDYGLLLQSKKLRGELVVRIARQGIAGVLLELPQDSARQEESVGAPAIDENLFAQLPAILGAHERSGRCMLREDRVIATVRGNGDAPTSTPWRGSATRVSAKWKGQPSPAQPSSAEAKV